MLPKLYGYWRSSASWRIRWALDLKKIPYEYIPVNILQGEHQQESHLQRAPLGTLPVLEISRGEYLSQSMAMLLWLEENFAVDPMLLGKDRTHRYKIIELCEIINADTAPLQTPRAQKRHSGDAIEKAAFARHFIELGLDAFEKKIAKSSGSFCLGDRITAADLFVVPQLYNAKRFEIKLEGYPNLNKVWNTCMSMPECIKSSPEKQSDAL